MHGAARLHAAHALGDPMANPTRRVHEGMAALATGCALALCGGRRVGPSPHNPCGSGWHGMSCHINRRRRLLHCSGSTSNPEANRDDARLWKKMVAFIVPTYALVVTNMILTAIDKAFIGNISSLQLAALGPSTAVFDCTSYLLTFLNTATLTLLGSHQGEDLNRIRSHALAFATIGGLVQGALLLVASVRAVRLLGAVGPMIPFSAAYLQIRALGAPVDRAGSISTQFALAQKDGVTPMLATLIAALFNVAGDYLLCRRFGVAGAAFATVAASAVSAVFLAQRLRSSSLWPRPFEWPSFSDFKPFASFAGPVFVVLLMKIILFSLMTAGATALGTAPAAAHQVLVSVFFVCGIAFGQPLSWAAQAFLPGVSRGPERRRVIRALLTVSAAFASLSGAMAWLMASFCLTWFTRDPLVLLQAKAATPAIVSFVVSYTAFLALEGIAIASQRLRACLTIAVAVTVAGGLTIWGLSVRGSLSLPNLWASQVASVSIGAILIGSVALRP